MKKNFFLLVVIFLFFFSFVYAQMDDVEKIILKLQGRDAEIEPPDERSAKEIYESISLSDKSELLTRVVNEKLIRDLWDEIQSDKNKKDLIEAGLTDRKIDELLDVWDELKDERDFILDKKEELSENDEQLKSSFEEFMEEYIKKKSPLVSRDFDFKYDDLDRYSLDYFEGMIEPEHIKVNHDDGLVLMFPLEDLPMGLKKIIVNSSHIVYENNYGGKFLVNLSGVYPVSGGGEDEWEVKGFKDLAENSYDVFINFGKEKNGLISTVEGGFFIDKKAFIELNNNRGTVYNLFDLEDEGKNFIVLYDNQVYVFRGLIDVLFNYVSVQYNITEIAIDKSGVLTDVSGRLDYENEVFSDSSGSLNSKLAFFENKFLSLREDSLFSGEKLMRGNFNEVLGREFKVNNKEGIDFELNTINKEIHSGHLIKDNRLIFQQGFINSQRDMPGASNVFIEPEKTLIGTTLVDLTKKRGSKNMAKNFLDFFSEKLFYVDRYYNYNIKKQFLSNGFFG